MLFAAGAAAVCLISACAPSAPSRGPSIDASRSSQNAPANARSRPVGAERAPVLVGGNEVSWADLRPALVEAAGAVALEEAALDLLLESALAERGLRWEDLDTQGERALLIEQLAESSRAAPQPGIRAESRQDRGERLLADLRAARGLGPTRFEGYLRRNAALRTLVGDEVALNESVIRQAYDLRYGERIPVRILVATSLDRASEAVERIDAGEPFAEVAARLSVDESASRGGLLEPINPADPSYPRALRDAVRGLAPGERSQIIALDSGFAVVWREPGEVRSADRPALETVRAELERDARRRQERILMGEKARELLGGSRITIFDPALDRAWRVRTGAER